MFKVKKATIKKIDMTKANPTARLAQRFKESQGVDRL